MAPNLPLGSNHLPQQNQTRRIVGNKERPREDIIPYTADLDIFVPREGEGRSVFRRGEVFTHKVRCLEHCQTVAEPFGPLALLGFLGFAILFWQRLEVWPCRASRHEARTHTHTHRSKLRIFLISTSCTLFPMGPGSNATVQAPSECFWLVLCAGSGGTILRDRPPPPTNWFRRFIPQILASPSSCSNQSFASL